MEVEEGDHLFIYFFVALHVLWNLNPENIIHKKEEA